MEQLFNEAPRNPVPYRATRTFPTPSETSERKFEPSWARSTSNPMVLSPTQFPIPSSAKEEPVSYTREDIFKILKSIDGPWSPPPPEIQACPNLLSMEAKVAERLLDESYYTQEPTDDDPVPPYSLLSASQPKTFESRGLSGRGRGRGMDFGGGWSNSFDLNAKWPSHTRGPLWRPKHSSESTDLPASYPRRRVASECSHSESVSEGHSESPLETGPDWQFFPGDETDGDRECTSPASLLLAQEGEVLPRSNSQNNTFDAKTVSWPDTSSLYKSKRGSDALESKNSEVEYPNAPQQKARDPHSFSFLNPSNVQATLRMSNANRSKFATTIESDLKFKPSLLLRGTYSEADILNTPSFDVNPDSQDPRHQWFYVDPKENIQGPFHSDLMDSWYGRKFFPPTLPIWRECDSQSFKLTNLLNLTGDSKQPFSIGAERLLIPKEFSPVPTQTFKEASLATQESSLDSRLPTRDQSPPNTHLISTGNTSGVHLKTDSFDEAEKCDPAELSLEETTQQYNIDTIELYSTDLSPKENSEIPILPSPPDDVFQHIPLESSQEFENYQNSPEPKVTPNSFTEHKSTQPVKNMWLSGPPKIPEQLTKLATQVSPVDDADRVQTFQSPPISIENPEKEQIPEDIQQISEEAKAVFADKPKIKSKSKSTSSIIDTKQDKAGWTKVGLEKKQKSKTKKTSKFACKETVSPSNLTSEESTQNNQPNRKAKQSSNRFKLDELDSFCLGRQNASLLPPLPNDVPLVNFDTILFEQAMEEETNNSIRKTTMEDSREGEGTAQAKKPTWASSPTETATASFLEIEREQKETARWDGAMVDDNRIREAQTAIQPTASSSWARVTKRDKQNDDCFTPEACETVSYKEIVQTNRTTPSVSITETDGMLRTPGISPTDESYVKPKCIGAVSKPQPSGIVPDRILLSPTCYEWARKEILSLNEGMDPPTVISFLQEFNGLFEITQFGSEMFGTSERTNTLCKRIYEDLARVKKGKHKTTQLLSAEDDWVKAKRKSNKSNKKKGKPSKSSED